MYIEQYDIIYNISDSQHGDIERRIWLTDTRSFEQDEDTYRRTWAASYAAAPDTAVPKHELLVLQTPSMITSRDMTMAALL